jgi:predicted AAA+ superfamily ATPase
MRIKRKLLKRLLDLQESRKITVIIGPRQSGKTTLLKMIRDSIREQGYKTLFLDIDLFSEFEKIATFENIINTLKLHGFQEDGKEPFFLFLDEFQRYEDVSVILKNLYDHRQNLKIYATGSSSLTIKQSIQESLAGRKLIYNLYPLDFEEFLDFKNDAGFLFENFILSEIIKRETEPSDLKFWGDKNQREVDLVIDTPSRLTALEMKFKERIKDVDFSGLRAFAEMYGHREPNLFLVNIGEQYKKENVCLRLPFHIYDF